MSLSRREFLVGSAVVGAAMATAKISSAAVFSNPIVVENQQPGSRGWVIWEGGRRESAFTTNGQIVGFSSDPSVNVGGRINFHVSTTPAQSYRVEIYRMGWYQGLGGRLMTTLGPFVGIPQPAGVITPTTGLIECQWPISVSIAIPPTWTSGVYVASLINSQNYQYNILFVVRDDNRVANFLYQQPVFTDAAYGNFPNDHATGKGLYENKSYGPVTLTGTTRAVQVSLDRPTPHQFRYGSWHDWSWENALLYFLEHEGYDVSYSTNLDTHTHPERLIKYKALLSAPHDEYWTKEMRDAWEHARDTGVHLAFFGANSCGVQVRMDAASSGMPNRIVTCYKKASLDPITDGRLKATSFSDLTPPRPEQSFVGVQYLTYTSDVSGIRPFLVQNGGHWVYANTGLATGSSIPTMVGYEIDQRFPNVPDPANSSFTVLGASPFVSDQGKVATANTTLYQAPSGAWVFASGTMSWSWALGRVGYTNAGVQQMMRNLLGKFLE